MKNRPQFALPGGLIQVTESGADKMVAERDFERQQHIDELNKGQAVEGSAVNAVVLAAIQQGGLPPVSQQAAFFDAAKSLAKLISDDQLVRRAEKIKELLKELKMYAAPAALIWSCKQAGVELFDPDPRDAAVESVVNDLGVEKKPLLVEH